MFGASQIFITSLFRGNTTFKLLALQMTKGSTVKEVTFKTTIQTPSKTLQGSFTVVNKKEKDVIFPYNITFNFGDVKLDLNSRDDIKDLFEYLEILSKNKDGGINLQNNSRELLEAFKATKRPLAEIVGETKTDAKETSDKKKK